MTKQSKVAGIIILLFLMSSTLLLHAAYSAPDSIILPAGFVTDTVISSGLEYPIDMEFLPNGDFLVAEKGFGDDVGGISHIKLVTDSGVQADPVLTLSTNVYWDSGLLAFVLDPDFTVNKYIYVWYATGENALNWDGETTQRLSRFTLNETSTQAVAGSELIMLDTGTWSQWHHGNVMYFDEAKNLYLGIGEQGNGTAANQLDRWEGKIIRIKPTDTGYSIPSDNPFIDMANIKREIYAVGFRNPFRVAVRSSDGLAVIGDVGGAAWEEIDILSAGSDYGWPTREGLCPVGEFLPCSGAPPQLTDPAIAYEHTETAGSYRGAITGLAFYEGTIYPEEYRGQLFFGDLSQQFIRVANLETNEVTSFATNISGLVDLEYYDGKLYILRFDGQIIEIDHVNSLNVAPSISWTADVMSGPAPLDVTFSATTVDVDSTLFTYEWNFGDGITSTTEAAATGQIAHTYSADGTYDATLYVKDDLGAKSALVALKISVYSGEFPVIELVNLTNPTRQNYHAGDTIQYNVTRSTIADLEAAIPFSWQIDLHHNVHSHPLIANTDVTSGTLTIPTDNHDNDWDLWYNFTVSMHTLSGQDVLLSKALLPEYATLSINTAPENGTLVLNNVYVSTPYVLKSIVGIENEVEAPEELWGFSSIYNYDFWETGLITSTNRVLHWNAPLSASGTVYTATYQYDRPIAARVFLPVVDN